MKKLFTLIVLLVAATAAAPAASADTACFDWVCSASGTGCTFDATCSVGSPFIWKYHWSWGDGTSSGLVSNPLQSHVYPSNVFKPTVTMQVWTFQQVTTVSCQITNREGVGHPLPYFSGRCTSK